MAARNIRDVNKRIANGEIFPKHLAYYVGDMLYMKRSKPLRTAPQSFKDTHKLFEESGHIESLPTTREAQESIFDEEMAQFIYNPLQFYNSTKDDTCKWMFSASNHRVRKIFEHHHMERWFDKASGVGDAHFTEKEWKAFGF